MTGFARLDGVHDGSAWAWEIKSVNNRGIDIRLRLPPGFEALELAARQAISQAVGRGSVQAGFTLAAGSSADSGQINQEVLSRLVDQVKALADMHDLPRPDLGALLALRGAFASHRALI